MLNPIYVCNNIKIFIYSINIIWNDPIANESNIKILLFFLERAIQRLPFSLEFCKLDIRDLLFSIQGISSFEKVLK